MFAVYILQCADNTYHSGVTKNLTGRLAYHTQGQNPEAYTYSRRPLHLAYSRTFQDVREAQAFEAHLKPITPEKIEALIRAKEEPDSSTTQHAGAQVSVTEPSSLMPLTYLGTIAWFSWLKNHPETQLSGGDLYRKQTYRNRCVILGANGPQDLIVPVERSHGEKVPLQELVISYRENWQKDHMKAIESAYRNTPFYLHYAPDLMAILEKRFTYLSDLNLELIRLLAQKVGISRELSIHPQAISFQEPVMLLIEPKQRKNFQHPAYRQVFATKLAFEPNLSLLDALFNLGPEAAQLL